MFCQAVCLCFIFIAVETDFFSELIEKVKKKRALATIYYSWMVLKVLIFGGTGYIGSQIAKKLQKKGHQIYIASRGGAAKIENGILCDITKKEQVLSCFKQVNPDVVVNSVSLWTSDSNVIFFYFFFCIQFLASLL
jgi:hypothetical protein